MTVAAGKTKRVAIKLTKSALRRSRPLEVRLAVAGCDSVVIKMR